MFKAKTDTTENYDTILEIITETNMSAEDVLIAITNWHGLQILDKDFTKNFIDEYGY